MTDRKQTSRTTVRNLEYSNAYRFKSKSRESSTSIVSDLSRGISFDEIGDDLLKVVRMLESEKTPATLKNIKAILKRIPATYSDLITSWADNNDMNLFHHVIINNCPELVEFLLTESNWFPAKHMPTVNPYAHLAAMCGFTECLRLILNHRPQDYFSASDHTLKLPSNIRRRAKYTGTMKKGVKKQINKLLGIIQSSADVVEMSILQKNTKTRDMDDVNKALANELRALEDSKRELDSHMINKKTAQFIVEGDGSKNKKRETSTVATVPGSFLKTQTIKDSNDTVKVHFAREGGRDDKYTKYKKQPMGAAGKKHIITVYCDEFSEAPPGIVRGAGEKVIVKYCEKMMTSKLESSQPPDRFFSRSLSPLPAISPHQHISKHSVKKITTTPQEYRSRADSTVIFPKIVEPGVRGKGKYKDFHLKIESRKVYPKDDSKSLRNKTPLSLAAEYGHLECVKMILDTHILRNNPTTVVKEPLTLATKAKSPDTILFLLNQRISLSDYQSAVLTAIREMYPDCLTALLAQKQKERHSLFDGVNLYHILYTQSLMSDYRYEMLPIMTNVLISSSEDVNAHNVYCTFPMYTLINCAFNISIGKQIFYYLNCLKMLLDSKANPHYDEEKESKIYCIGQTFSRSAYSSAINCILENAVNSINFFENIESSKIFMKKLIATVTTCDKTSRRMLNDTLFHYMDTVCLLGIDHYIVKCFLRYGANPNVTRGNKYALNVYFDVMLPYLARFQVDTSYRAYQPEINALMALCRGMTYKCLKEAQLIFLNENLMHCPIQALPLLRHFSYGLNELLKTPRPLTELVGQYIWLRFRRNEKRVKTLPVSDDIIAFILP